MEAMRRQMERATFAPPMHGIADVTLDFVEKLGAVAPGNLNLVKPFSGGSEAVEAAIKLVRQYYRQTGFPGKFVREPLLAIGGTFGGMAVSGNGSRKSKFDPQLPSLKARPVTIATGSHLGGANRLRRAVEDVIVHEDRDDCRRHCRADRQHGRHHYAGKILPDLRAITTAVWR
jgi:adenosylmethionine-8-amino-7-oxononanoate aminotransferase